MRFFLAFLMLLTAVVQAQVPLTLHTPPAGIPVPGTRSNHLIADGNGQIWVAFAIYGLASYDGISWTRYHTGNSPLPSDSVICLHADPTGAIWAGTGGGLAKKDGGTWTVFNTVNSGLPSNTITAVYSDGPVVYAGTNQGLATFNGSSWSTENTGNSGLPNDSITAITKDAAGNLWVGTLNGLAMKSGSGWTTWVSPSAGLSRAIYNLLPDTYSRIWVSSYDPEGLSGNMSNYKFTYFENGTAETVEGKLYHNERPLAYRRCNPVIGSQNKVLFISSVLNTGLMSVDADTLQFYRLQTNSIGSDVKGSRLVFDASGNLWTLTKSGFNLYQLQLSGFSGSPGMNEIHNFRLLDINDVVAGVNADGILHSNDDEASYRVPANGVAHSILSSSLWMGGVDASGNLHLAARTYGFNGTDYQPGPVGGITVPFDTSVCYAFDRVWKVYKWQVESFKAAFLAGNVTNGTYKIPEALLSWPAKGNGIVNGDLAPFYDFDNDDSYNPYAGDYPLIKGDQMLFHVFNDSLSAHTSSGGDKLGVEVRTHSYAFSCANGHDSLMALNRSTFYRYEIINRSAVNFSNFYIGLWSEVDLGNWDDDQVGSDSTRAAGFVYNGDNNDETVRGYGVNPPMQNIKILRGPLADPGDNTDNNLNGIIDEPGETCSMNYFMEHTTSLNSPQGFPQLPADYYHYLQGIWLDNQHLTYGDDGRNLSNAPSNFIFSGIPYASSGWTAMGNVLKGDKRFVMACGPFTLQSGDTAFIDFAYIFTRDSLSPNGFTTSTARNLMDLDRVQFWFENNSFPSCQTVTTGLNEHQYQSLQLYPNPATDYLFLETGTHNSIEISYTIYNSLGDVVMSGITSKNSIYIKNLPPQMYIIKAEIGGSIKVAKFVRKD